MGTWPGQGEVTFQQPMGMGNPGYPVRINLAQARQGVDGLTFFYLLIGVIFFWQGLQVFYEVVEGFLVCFFGWFSTFPFELIMHLPEVIIIIGTARGVP